MDDIFVRSVFRTRVNIDPKDLDKTFLTKGGALDRALKAKISGILPQVGYIKPGSLTLLERSPPLIEGSHFSGSCTFHVRVSVKSLVPFKGLQFRSCLVTGVSKFGIVAQPTLSLPFIIFIPIVEKAGDIVQEVQAGNRIDVTVVDFKLRPPNKDLKHSSYWIVASLDAIVNQDELINYLIRPAGAEEIQFQLTQAPDYNGIDTSRYTGAITFKIINEIKDIIQDINTNYDSVTDTFRGNQKITKFWDQHVKHFINEYELIYPIHDYMNFANLYSTHEEYIDRRIISRAYFKMHEMLGTQYPDIGQRLIDSMSADVIKILCLGEAPGGFLQSILHNRKSRMVNDLYYAVSITTDSHKGSTRTWDKLVKKLQEAKESVTIFLDQSTEPVYHPDNSVNGSIRLIEDNLFNPAILDMLKSAIANGNGNGNGADFITADARNEIEEEMLAQEEMQMYKLIFTEVVYALVLQKEHGTFILKIYDMLTPFTIKMINYLSQYYSYMYVTKPHTSRGASSEKYLVCIDFKGGVDTTSLQEVWNLYLNNTEGVIVDAFLLDVEPELVASVTNYNNIFMQKQIELFRVGKEHSDVYMSDTTPDKTVELIKSNIERQKQVRKAWFERFPLP